MYRSTNGRASLAEPEIWFRIVHVALEGAHGAPVAAYREQTVEIALGPKGAFENGNVGTLTRRVPADRALRPIALIDERRQQLQQFAVLLGRHPC